MSASSLMNIWSNYGNEGRWGQQSLSPMRYLELLEPAKLQAFIQRSDGYGYSSSMDIHQAIHQLGMLKIMEFKLTEEQNTELIKKIDRVILVLNEELKKRNEAQERMEETRKIMEAQREAERIRNLPIKEKLEMEIESWCGGILKTLKQKSDKYESTHTYGNEVEINNCILL